MAFQIPEFWILQVLLLPIKVVDLHERASTCYDIMNTSKFYQRGNMICKSSPVNSKLTTWNYDQTFHYSNFFFLFKQLFPNVETSTRLDRYHFVMTNDPSSWTENFNLADSWLITTMFEKSYLFIFGLFYCDWCITNQLLLLITNWNDWLSTC